MAVDYTKGMIDSPNFNKYNLPNEGDLVLLGVMRDGNPEGTAATIDARAFSSIIGDNPLTPDDFNNLVNLLKSYFQPIGTIIPWVGFDPSSSPADSDEVRYKLPNGDLEWMVCNGSSLSREDYPELFNVLGTTYGNATPDEFNIPDFRGRMLAGSGKRPEETVPNYGEFGTEYTEGGEALHELTVNELPSHAHEYTLSNQIDAFNSTPEDTQGDSYQIQSYSASGDYQTNTEGQNNPHENRPPFSIVNWIIRVK